MSDNAILAAMRRMRIGKEEMTGHGFRAVARTILDEVLGVRPDFIEHQLAHAVRDPNGRAYNRTAHLAERRAMMQLWSGYLDRLKSATVAVPDILAGMSSGLHTWADARSWSSVSLSAVAAIRKQSPQIASMELSLFCQ
jgi:hypothetical protein